MIRLFNRTLKKEILIDDSIDAVQLNPREYEIDNPHIIIELYGLKFLNHANKCEDCDTLIKSLGTNTSDWYVEFNGKVLRLDLRRAGRQYTDNQIKQINSVDFNGTRLKLNLDLDTVEDLEEQLSELENNEEYEKCCFFRDKINSIKTFQNEYKKGSH